MNEEIYYLVAYEKSSGKWRSADEMLGYLVSQATGGTSPVHFINDDGEPEWRNLSDGLETDTDFDNAQMLGGFLRMMNEEGMQ